MKLIDKQKNALKERKKYAKEAKTKLEIIKLLPVEIQEIEVDSHRITSEENKKEVSLVLDFYSSHQKKAEETLETLKRLGVSFTGKYEFNTTYEQFTSEGTLLYGGYSFFIKIENLPKPENCELVERTRHIEAHDEIYYEAICPEPNGEEADD